MNKKAISLLIMTSLLTSAVVSCGPDDEVNNSTPDLPVLSTEANTTEENTAEASTEAVTEKTTEASTESSESTTESTTKTEESTEETTTEEVTEASTEAPTEEPTEAPTEAPTEPVVQNVKFGFDTLLSSAGNVTSALGEPMNVATAPSCYTNGADSKIYTYDGLIVECYVLDGAETICGVTITNGNYSTDKGIKIGSSKADVEAAYGAGEEIGYYTIYASGDKELDVKYEGDIVTELSFLAAV